MDDQRKLAQLLKKAKVEQEGPASLVEDIEKLDEQYRTIHQVNALSKGDKGDAPVAGKDFFTDEDKQHMIEAATPRKGEHYFTPDEIKEFAEAITPQKGVHYFDGENGADGVTPVKGVDYFTQADIDDIKEAVRPKDGVDGQSVTVEAVLEALMSLTGDAAAKFSKKVGAVVDINHLRNAQSFRSTFKFNGTKYDVSELMHGGGSSTSSGGLNFLTATGTVDDSNKIFTFASTPTIVVVNGASYINGAGVTIVTTTATLDNPAGTGGSVYGLGS